MVLAVVLGSGAGGGVDDAAPVGVLAALADELRDARISVPEIRPAPIGC